MKKGSVATQPTPLFQLLFLNQSLSFIRVGVTHLVLSGQFGWDMENVAKENILFKSFRSALCRMGNRCLANGDFTTNDLDRLYTHLQQEFFCVVFLQLSDELANVFSSLCSPQPTILKSWVVEDPIWNQLSIEKVDGHLLGLTYERLLGLSPVVVADKFTLRTMSNRQRRNGSYYTDVGLVNTIVEAVVGPFVNKVALHNRALQLTAIRICDPSCGSGVFLRAAACFLTEQITLRWPLEQAFVVQQVVQQCIYGVDIDPIAVGLCLYSLHQISAVSYGELARNIQCGNSLLGVFDLPDTIPNEAFVPVRGEDTFLHDAKQNHNKYPLVKGHCTVSENIDFLSDMWCSAFLWPLSKERNVEMPTNAVFQSAIRLADNVSSQLREQVQSLAKRHKLFHWKRAFPHIFANNKRFTIVLGNPPYLFLSGKGNPIKKLWDKGKREESQALAREVKLASFLYAQTSAGCKDLYKWFVLLSSRIAENLGLVIPSGWISLPRYADVNQLLVTRGLHTIWNLGRTAFPGVTLPICAVKTKDGHDQEIVYLDQSKTGDSPSKSYHFAKNGFFEMFLHPLAEQIFSGAECFLSDHIEIAEGAHHVKWDRNKPNGISVNVFVDSEMQRFVEPRWVSTNALLEDLPKNRSLHKGSRILLRKTGDGLVSSMVVSEGVIWANQNVYVIKAKNNTSIELIQGLLASQLYTFLYRGSPFGQQGRGMAQLRLKAIKKLPFPTAEKCNLVEERISEVVVALHRQFSQQKWGELNDLVYQMFSITPEQIFQIAKWSKALFVK